MGRKGPALYELIRPGPGADTSKPPAPRDDLEHNVLSPGRSVRLSVGGLAVIGAITIALLVISWAMGFRRGEAIARADYATRVLADMPVDPINAPPVAAAPSGADPAIPAPRPPKAAARAWGAVLGDPRAAGQRYFIIAETSPDGAMRLAAFCREQGLETYVVSGHNARLRRVIALPALSTDSRSNEAVKRLEDAIHAVGRRWKASGGATDLHDAYPSLYRGT